MDWNSVVDIRRALINCHIDILGDWHRDPWSWPELDWVVESKPDLVLARLKSSGVHRVSKIDVPKEKFSTRPAVVMDPLDRLAYQALIDVSSVALIGDLRPWVFGWRLARGAPSAGRYVSNKQEWKAYRARLKLLVRLYDVALVTDIVSFFASIPIDRLSEDIRQLARNDVTKRLVNMLDGWAGVSGRSGLPQRCMASSALANLYLRPLDDALDAAAGSSHVVGGVPLAIRWMDDIWIFGDEEGELRKAQLRIEARMRDLGLHMGVAKTDVLTGDALVEAALQIEHSAVDVGLESEPSDEEPLQELVARLVDAPETASRTSIKFACTRVRDAQRLDLARRFVSVAHRMPHGADHLARLFREFGLWRELADWYVEYCASPWSIEWSCGQFGTMFPAKEAVPIKVAGLFVEVLPRHNSLPVSTIAAQRLAAWRPDDARELLRETAGGAADPLERRSLALAALSAREEVRVVEKLLREYKENEPTLLMLRDVAFRAPPVSKDYAG